jgi:hypothetical protein
MENTKLSDISAPLIINPRILCIRGNKVMLDSDLAELYGVETKVLNQAVKRNIERFPDDFMYQLTLQEVRNLKSQIVTSSYGGKRKRPFVFTEQGIAMLSSVLRSELAIKVNIQIMRAFVKIRNFLATNKELAAMVHENRQAILEIMKVINELRSPPEKPRRRIGFNV